MSQHKAHAVKLSGLPDRAGDVEAVSVDTVREAVAFLITGESITAADDCGSIAVWFTDDGFIRGEFMRYQNTVSEGRWPTVRDAHDWLDEWWPAMSDLSL